MDQLKQRIENIINCLNTDLYEREEIIAVAFLATLSGQNTFLLGPPGTAKSLIARRLSQAFATKDYFEYLMQRFSTPEEIFGPISISELKKDNYIRKTTGFLPEADFAFLDEIWKSSPAILNTLLTIINEKLFRNGTKITEVPLKALLSASNETPPLMQGLDALYDRFIVRLYVPPMQNSDNFTKLIKSNPIGSTKNIIPKELIIDNEEWEFWKLEIEEIEISDETINIIRNIKSSIIDKNKKTSNKNKELEIYISDRLWQKAMILIKAGAFFCDRSKTNLVDTLLLRHCLWTSNDNREDIIKIVESAVRDCGFETGFNMEIFDEEKNALEEEINEELYCSEDIYKTKQLKDRNEYIEHTINIVESYPRIHECPEDAPICSKKKYYIPLEKIKTKDKFNPVDSDSNEIKEITCCFDGQGSYSVQYRDRNIYLPHLEKGKNIGESIIVSLIIDFHKGDKREVNKILTDGLQHEVKKFIDKTNDSINNIKQKRNTLMKELNTPFVPDRIRSIAIESIDKQLEDMQLRYKDLERIKSLI